MRDHKYRGWITELNRYADHVEVYGDGSFSLGINTTGGGEYGFDGILEQYTGLKDSTRTEEFPDGKEIYENDILMTECDEIRYINKKKDTKHFKSTGNVICKWEGYGFYFDHDKKSQHGINLTTIEIISNIHEANKTK